MYGLNYIIAFGFVYLKERLYDLNELDIQLPEYWKILPVGSATFIYIDPDLYLKDIIKLYNNRFMDFSDYDDFKLSFEGLFFNISDIMKQNIRKDPNIRKNKEN